jgi:hypothetical protein
MTNFLLFVLSTIGMTLIITRGDIFSEFREWIISFAPKLPDNESPQILEDGTTVPLLPVQLTTSQYLRRKITSAINCCQCTGFWCGIFCGIWYVYCGSDIQVNFITNLFMLFLCGCIGSFASLTADIFLEYLVRFRPR